MVGGIGIEPMAPTMSTRKIRVSAKCIAVPQDGFKPYFSMLSCIVSEHWRSFGFR
jgi:hypothetical protein